MSVFSLHSNYDPSGDQPKAIAELTAGIRQGLFSQTLLGATGTGKTFTIANVIQQVGKPTLVLSHNKTLAGQLYGEFKSLFPDNSVEYFVSHFDYYQPEAYVAASDTYIQKDSSINDRIEKLRHSATRSLIERKDVIIVSSVSCIYGIGSRKTYDEMVLIVESGTEMSRQDIISRLVDIQYERNEVDFHRGTFRCRGDIIEVFPAHEDSQAIRIELFDDEIERLSLIDPLRGKRIETLDRFVVFPASHYVTPRHQMLKAIDAIRIELDLRLAELNTTGRLLEAQRLEERTRFDLEMLEETGRCKGIENYSRFLSGREKGEPPPTLLEYFSDDWLLVVDESHVTIPQVRGMYRGDRSRKENLVQFGFRLPSALDNRPLRFDEFYQKLGQVIYVSATPSDYEINESQGIITEQIIRPTGLLDPIIEVRPLDTQVDDLFDEIKNAVQSGGRVLVTVLTKRMAQELTDHYDELGLKARYLHSDIDTLERLEIIRDLRMGVFDVLIGINLLREGLDIPEVTLVAVLDADKEGFLRNKTSLIQTIGRAARNAEGKAILYAAKTTESMRVAIDETQRRREIQQAYNVANNIVPESISKTIKSPLSHLFGSQAVATALQPKKKRMSSKDIPKRIASLRKKMLKAAADLEFEKAAVLRDEIKSLEEVLLL